MYLSMKCHSLFISQYTNKSICIDINRYFADLINLMSTLSLFLSDKPYQYITIQIHCFIGFNDVLTFFKS